MALLSLSVVDPAVDALTIGMVLLALYYVVRQRLNRVYDAKVQLVIVYLCFLAGMALETMRDFTVDPAVVSAYTVGQVALILMVVALLTCVSYSYSFRSAEPGLRQRVSSAFAGSNAVYGAGLILALAYFVFLEWYLITATPYSIVEATLGGTTIAAPRFYPSYVALLYAVLGFYLLCPLPLFLMGARKTSDPEGRHAFVVLPLSWTAVGGVLLLFNGLLPVLGLNLLVVGHAILALTFGITALYFRNVRLLGRMFEPMEAIFPYSIPIFSKALGLEAASFKGNPMLLEVEPSSNYEGAVKDYVVEWQSRKSTVYVFTPSSSPVMKTLQSLPEVRIFELTDAVSYAEPSADPHRTRLPQNRPEVIADVTSKMMKASGTGETTVVFDSVSALAVSLGEEAALGLVHRMLDTLSGGSTTSLFLTTRGADSPRLALWLDRLFARHLVFDSAGLRERDRERAAPPAPMRPVLAREADGRTGKSAPP